MAVPLDGTRNRHDNLIQMDESGFFTFSYIGNVGIQLTRCIIMSNYCWYYYCVLPQEAQYQYIVPNMKV
ncbi:hypothetical protein CXF95_25425 [Paraglaciecola sp. MB-3u-78]|jgi:hypothetical protein|nr:hypothetical protein CXF95_25425 [Paraglaciecola sp. MB-3u-78]